MRHKLKGIVIREAPKGETSKLLTVLTDQRGVITVTAKGVRNISSPYLKSARLFAFSDMLLYEKNGFYTLTEASLVTDFYSLSGDIKRYALACYISEVAANFCVPGDDSVGILRLLLNSLYALENEKAALEIIKSAFELRICSECGFFPEVSCCEGCGKELSDSDAVFNILEGVTFCRDCINIGGENILIPVDVRKAISHITESEMSRFISFRIGTNEQKILSAVAERFMLSRAERGFKTLSFYKKCEELQ